MKSIPVISLILVFLLSGLANAEGLADRRNEASHSGSVDHMIIKKIHMMHGPTAAGPSSKMKEHGSEMHHSMPTYMSERHKHKHLNAHQYRRKVFGSN